MKLFMVTDKVNHFKKINDSYDHNIGDKAISSVA